MSEEPKVYLHEIIRTVPGREESYMATVLSVSSGPGRGERPDHHRQLGQFRTADTAGPWPGVINIWEHTWASQAAALERQFQDRERDTAMEDWWQRNLHQRRGGYDRWLIPTAYTETAAGLAKAGVRGRVFWHEILWLPMGGVDDYLAALEQEFLPAALPLGAQLVGAYRVALRPRQALVLLAFRDWGDLSRLLAARDRDPALRKWFAHREQQLQRVDELILIPGRLNPLGIKD